MRSRAIAWAPLGLAGPLGYDGDADEEVSSSAAAAAASAAAFSAAAYSAAAFSAAAFSAALRSNSLICAVTSAACAVASSTSENTRSGAR